MEIIKGKIRWIDIARPTGNDLDWLKREFHFHPVILEELKDPSARARVEQYDEYLYLIYQFPIYDPIEKVSRRTEIDFLITKKEVVTIRYEDNLAFDEFKDLIVNEDFKEKAFQNSLHFTYQLIDSILSFDQRQLHHVRGKVERIGNDLFKDREQDVLEEVSYVKRDLSEYQIIFEPQGEVLKSLLENGVGFWGPSSRPYLSALVGEHLKLLGELESYRTAVRDFESTNIQMMNVKTNDVMKKFTMLSFITFPLTLVVAVFGIGARDTPILHWAGAFWMFCATLILAIIIMLLYLKAKKWL